MGCGSIHLLYTDFYAHFNYVHILIDLIRYHAVKYRMRVLDCLFDLLKALKSFGVSKNNYFNLVIIFIY